MSRSPCQQRAALCPCPQVYVLKRPHVDEFLQRMGELFECVLFTASLAKVGAPDLPCHRPCLPRHHSSGTAPLPAHLQASLASCPLCTHSQCQHWAASLPAPPRHWPGKLRHNETWQQWRAGCHCHCGVGRVVWCVMVTPLLCLQYADPVADLLDKWGAFRARLFRESCVFHRGNYVKDLSRLGRDLRRIIIVDNSPASYIFHPDNAVCTHRARLGGVWR